MIDVARVLVCEDSPTYARALREFLERDEDLRVVGTCQSGEALLRALPGARADLVTMDVELPGIDGVETTRRLMASRPLPVLVLSGHTPRGSARTAAALTAGALDVLAKSDLRLDDPAGPAAIALRRRIKRLACARVRSVARAGGAGPPRPGAAAPGRPAGVIGLCASTGGPQALHALLAELPADFPIPLLAVQHIAGGFLEGLVRWLDGCVGLPVRIARQGSALAPGVTFAPDDAHLLLREGRLELDPSTVAGPHRPSGDVLLRSLSARGPDAVAVVLSGMGRDGVEGLAAVGRAGGLTIAQDEASSAVYGMPRVAAERGAELSLCPSAIGAALTRLRVPEGVT